MPKTADERNPSNMHRQQATLCVTSGDKNYVQCPRQALRNKHDPLRLIEIGKSQKNVDDIPNAQR